MSNTKVNQSLGGYQNIVSKEDMKHLCLLEETYRFSQQQLSQLGQWMVDCRTWDEPSFFKDLEESLKIVEEKYSQRTWSQKRDWLFKAFLTDYQQIKNKEKVYEEQGQKEAFPKYQIGDKELKGRIFRLCPAASERAVCCNLKVLNIVDNCAMECSYCVLQNHYDEPEIKVPTNLKEKLAEVKIDPNKRYRICTGEYSDSLLWGNRNNILTDLCDFAARHPNIILELKTKTTNISYFLENDIPENVCCSWSLNPSVVIQNEEHKTASLEQRFKAARKVADKGIKVGFHIHPMMYFKGWEQAYTEVITQMISQFKVEEVLWVSLGIVTLMKGFEHELRKGYRHSKILQMEMETTPDGKITYAFEVRKKLYQNALKALGPWKNKVFQYLCMEHNKMWDEIMDVTYKNMKEFDDVFNEDVFSKLWKA